MSESTTEVKSLLGTIEASEASISSDAVLIERVQAGNMAAFDALIRKYRERLYSVIYNMTSNAEDAADLTQDSFIKAFRSIHNFKGNSSFYTWLYRIGINTTISFINKNKLRRFFSFDKIQEEGANKEVVDALVGDNDTEKSTLLKELQEKLNEALQILSISHRTVIVLYEIEGLSHQEVADIMGCSEGTVRSRLYYAKQQLQGLLKDYVRE